MLNAPSRSLYYVIASNMVKLMMESKQILKYYVQVDSTRTTQMDCYVKHRQ